MQRAGVARCDQTYRAVRHAHSPATLSLVCSARTLEDLSGATRIVTRESTMYYVLWVLPGLLFFTTYMLVVTQWARIFHTTYASQKRMVWPRRVFIGANVAFYIIQAGLFGLLMMGEDGDAAGEDHYRQAFLHAQPIFLGVVACLCAVAFLFYGLRLYTMFSRKLWNSKEKTRSLLSVSVVASFCTVCFLTRGIVNFVWVDAIAPMHPCLKAEFEVFFYLCIEILPCMAVLYAMRGMPPRTAVERRHLVHLPSDYDNSFHSDASTGLLGVDEQDRGRGTRAPLIPALATDLGSSSDEEYEDYQEPN